jgi:hypothetical protein
MVWDVDAITAANTAAITARAAATVAADPSGALRTFRLLADRAAASTNVDAEKIRCFDESDAILDARGFCIWQERGDRDAGLRAFHRRQGSWFQQRLAFEALWVGGESFRYFALNAGGLGTQGDFGKFCLLVSEAAERGRVAAIFPGDSLQRYTTASAVDSARVESEAAAWPIRGAVAVIERGAEALTVHEAGWPEVVCRPDHYLETVVGPPLPLLDVDEVRLPASYLDRLDGYDQRDFAGEVLEQDEANELRAFRSLQRWRRTHGLVISALR